MDAHTSATSDPDSSVDQAAAARENDAFSLADFKPGDVLFRSPVAAFRGWADSAGMITRSDTDYVGAVSGLADALRQQQRHTDMIFGAVPFSRQQPGYFFVPRQRRVPASAQGPSQLAAQTGREASRRELPDRQGYVQAVRAALEAIERGDVSKVVLARALDITLDAPVSCGSLLGQLLAQHRKGYTFAMPIPAAVDGGRLDMLVGASPELLARRQGRHIVVNPLAGSSARRLDPVLDAEAAHQLSVSEKDRREHAIVVDDIRQRLAPLCRKLTVPSAPSVVSTDTLWHLSTEITGELKDPDTTALDVALALHPTPAICGYPALEAERCIHKLEPFGRGFFAGLVGWQDVHGDGEWAIALRCAQVAGRHLRLYAGAGIVAGSDPEHEYEETATKLRTLLHALSDAA